MRCFIGVPLPEAWKQTLETLIRHWTPRFATRLHWTRPETWHVTLQFLGNVDPGRVPSIATALARLQFPRFALHVEGGGYFPEARQPRVGWLGFGEGTDRLARCAQDLASLLTPLGFPAESRAFVAHATLFRVRDAAPRQDDPWQILPQQLAAMAWPPALVERIVLWHSTLDPAGARHAPLAWVDASDAVDA
ncbi:RNA 2',3'-cyclic phosphodiesterase [Megalodesulfovibrio gigas]|uniref:RNA 2',3'-cyclic phosphodiesterase n=1 Tax=Megalodesulfovibrio gigas (strain ATCC 19364 / DSM 1382 / NCIMB 9332 / VKM B-1759) TaxID=1121448 RepID=T2GF54_MEGG1|nr:RNA 2',3'-cyclic phosphodiesterase [Megalodesulfovibrio gigas]AGW14751.1 putative 2'-5' RNA ligase [Megalodesulfovibrio gigas DSM 1382 = ATCC 19364]